MDRETLDAAVRAAFVAGDGDALAALLRAHRELKQSCSHEYPWVHRIGDVPRTKGSVRLIRCTTCDGRFYAVLQRQSGCPTPGVPLGATLDEQRARAEQAAKDQAERLERIGQAPRK